MHCFCAVGDGLACESDVDDGLACESNVEDVLACESDVVDAGYCWLLIFEVIELEVVVIFGCPLVPLPPSKETTLGPGIVKLIGPLYIFGKVAVA